jgi:hypothetical protein
MATQSATPQSLTQATRPMGNSAQLEPSSNINDRTKALILDMTYDAPAFKDVEEFRAAFKKAEDGAHAAAKKMFGNLVELVKYCAMVRSYLSERGVNAHLRKEAGIRAGFENWYTEFRDKYDIAWAFKTMLHKIAELEGGCEKCGRLTQNDADHKKSCILYRPLIEHVQPGENGGRNQIDMKAARNAYLAGRYEAMVGLLCNAPKDAKPEEIIATMQAEAQHAYEGLTEEEAKKIKVPKLVKESPRERDDKVIRRIAVGICEMLLEHGQGLKKIAVREGDGHTSYPGRTILNAAQRILDLDHRGADTTSTPVASAELASPVVVGAPRPAKAIAPDASAPTAFGPEPETAKEVLDYQPGQTILLRGGKKPPIQCEVVEVTKKRVHLRGPEGEDKGWISRSEIDRRLLKPASDKEVL